MASTAVRVKNITWYKNNPLIVEISYGYAVKAYDACEGYWTPNMQWYAGDHFDFCGWMVEEVMK